jgi:hypothetical protein
VYLFNSSVIANLYFDGAPTPVPNAVWEKYAHKAPKVDTSKLTNDIRNGYNPMFGRYTPKHKFEICDNHKLTDLQLYQSLCGVMPAMPGEKDELSSDL